jgi:hypothetical protein
MTKQHVKLAEALLRRKELQQKVDVLKNIKATALYEVRGQRVRVTESIDEVTAQVPLLQANQVTSEYDWHARQLRLVDAAIQQVNWTAEVELDASVMQDYKFDGVLVRK